MINREQFEEICNKYGLDSKKLIKNNENVLEKADYNSICYVLDFLRDTLKVIPNNIEKCPSILYLKIEAIKENWNFLNEKKINTRDVETCLHILSTDPEQLKKTYEYVSDENRYGKKYIEQRTSILSVPVERIQEIEEKCPELTKENKLSAAFSRRDIAEIKKIEQVCQENGIEVTGSVLSRTTAEEIKEIVKVCKDNGIEVIGSVFYKTAGEIKEIVELCKEKEIEVTPTMFKRTAGEIKAIVEVCQENGIEAIGSVFNRTAAEIKEIVKVCKDNGIEVTSTMFIRTAAEIKKIIEVCKENGIEVTPTMFIRTAAEIKEIVEVCKENGIEIRPTMLKRTAAEIKEIVKVCQEKEIEVTPNIFIRKAAEIKEIVDICRENRIKIIGSIFVKNSKQLKENIEYIKQNYGEEYLTSLIVSKNLKHLQKTLPYLQSIGVLEVIKTSSVILNCSLEEIKERQAFIESIGEPIVKENKFNSIFGLSRRNYQKKVKEYEEKKKLIGEIKVAIQEGQELDEQIDSKEQSQK